MKLIDHDFTIRPVRHGFRFGLCIAACGVLAITLPNHGTAQEASETPSGASNEVQTGQSSSATGNTPQAPLSGSGPRVGPALFQQDDRSAFVNAVRDELNYLAQAEPDTHTDFLVGIAQMVALKNYDVDEAGIRRGNVSVDPFEGLEPSSSESLGRLHDAVTERLENGVTVESIISMGKAHQDNAVTRYGNAIQRIIRIAEDRRDDVAGKQRRMESILARIAILDPEVRGVDATAELNLQLINGNQFPVSTVEIEVASRGTVNTGSSYGSASKRNVSSERITIDLEKPILPGERRSVSPIRFGSESGITAPAGKIRPVVASVTRITGQSGEVVTGDEYAEAMEMLSNVISEYRDAARSIDRRMDGRVSDLRERLTEDAD